MTPAGGRPAGARALRRQIDARVKAGTHAADRARVVHRQPDGAVHLSVRGAADDPGDARHGSSAASSSSSRTGARNSRRSSWERCGHDMTKLSSSPASRLLLALTRASRAHRSRRLREPCSWRAAAGGPDADPRPRSSICRRSRPISGCATSTSSACPSISADGQAQYQSDVPTAAVARPRRPAAVPAAEGHLRRAPPRRSAAVRPDDPAAPSTSNAPSSPSRRRASGRRCSRCGRKSTTRSSPRRCCRSGPARSPRRSPISKAACGETNVRVREGAALPADAAAIEATLLAAPAGRGRAAREPRAALARLSALTGAAIAGRHDVLALPELSRPSSRRPATTLNATRARPEYEQFDRTRDRARPAAGGRDRPGSAARLGVRPRRLRPARPQFHQRPVRVVRARRRAGAVEGVELGHDQTASARRSRSSSRSSPPTRRRSRRPRRAIETDLRRDRSPDRPRSRSTIASSRCGRRSTAAARARLQRAVITASEYLDRSTEWLDGAVRAAATASSWRRRARGADDARAGGAVMRATLADHAGRHAGGADSARGCARRSGRTPTATSRRPRSSSAPKPAAGWSRSAPQEGQTRSRPTPSSARSTRPNSASSAISSTAQRRRQRVARQRSRAAGRRAGGAAGRRGGPARRGQGAARGARRAARDRPARARAHQRLFDQQAATAQQLDQAERDERVLDEADQRAGRADQGAGAARSPRRRSRSRRARAAHRPRRRR